jgi:hypothetical protein
MANLPKYCDTPEKVEAWKAKRKAYNRAYHQTPEHKAAAKALNQTPERKAAEKAREKARAQTPKVKAYQKAYQQTPKGKTRQKTYRQTPKYKARIKAYLKAYRQTLSNQQSTADAFRMMQAASELAKALTNLSEPTPQNK